MTFKNIYKFLLFLFFSLIFCSLDHFNFLPTRMHRVMFDHLFKVLIYLEIYKLFLVNG